MGENRYIENYFGDILKELRSNKKISQSKLAEYSNLDRTYISLLERGKRQPSLNTIFAISSALNISPSNLIKKVEEKLNENRKG